MAGGSFIACVAGLWAATVLGASGQAAREAPRAGPLAADQAVRGWTILSDSEPDALAVIAAAPAYRINHLQLSHEIVNTRIIGRPSEINLVALDRFTQDPQVTAETVYDDFITARYGRAAAADVKAAFKNAFDIVSSALYTLGTSTTNHSGLDYDPYGSSYARHVSGKWIDPPVVFVRHNVNRELHYWKDVIDHLAPAWAKTPRGAQLNEVPWMTAQGWLRPGEQITAAFLEDVRREKRYGVRLAEASVSAIERAKPVLDPRAYDDLHHYFSRTLLTAKLHAAVAAAYFGFRLYARGDAFRTPAVTQAVREALDELPELARRIKTYPVKPAAGQWNWIEDADAALKYHALITQTGWPAATRGVPNPQAGLTFPASR